MTIEKLIGTNAFAVVTRGDNLEREISEPFCCDLLSVAMSRAPEAGVWVTVMGNMNTLAVATLTDVGCIILAEGMELDEAALNKAKQEEITVLKTESSVFFTALQVYELMKTE